MNSLRSFFPHTLSRERELAEIKCNLLIDAFNELVDFEQKRLNEEKALKLKQRKFIYSIKEIEDGWRILHRESETPNGFDDDVTWSTPFKIINDVLFHGSTHQGRSHINANKLIPQGLFDESRLNEINKDW